MSPDELLGRRIDQVANIAGDADSWHEKINAIRQNLPFRDFIFDVEPSDGDVRRFRANGRPVFDAEGRFRGYRGAAIDISAQMHAEGRARAAERRLHAALEQLPAGFALFDADDRMVMCNGKYREFYDLDPEEVAAHKTFEQLLRDAVARCVYGGDLAGDTSSSKAVAKGFEARLKAHRSASGQFDARLADGRWIEIRERPLPDGGIVAVHADVTETKLVSQELERKSNLLQTTLDHMTQGISVFDADLKLVVFNRRFHELLDFPHELGKPGTSFEEIIRYNAERGEYGPGDVEEQVRARVELARQFKPHRFERIRPDNRVIEVRGTPLPEGGFVSTYTDITDRKHAEWQAKRAQERLMDAIEASADGFVLFDSDDRLVLCNSRMRELYAGRCRSSGAGCGGVRDPVRHGSSRRLSTGEGPRSGMDRPAAASTRRTVGRARPFGRGRALGPGNRPPDQGCGCRWHPNRYHRAEAARTGADRGQGSRRVCQPLEG